MVGRSAKAVCKDIHLPLFMYEQLHCHVLLHCTTSMRPGQDRSGVMLEVERHSVWGSAERRFILLPAAQRSVAVAGLAVWMLSC